MSIPSSDLPSVDVAARRPHLPVPGWLRALGRSPRIVFGVRERVAARACAGIALAAGILGVLTLGGILGAPVERSRDREWRAVFEDWAPFMVNWGR